jgi:chemotaxis-related protein WspB
MLFLLFELDGDRYALPAAQIVEVLALAPAKAIPGAPPWIAGVIEHRGALVPVVDVPRLALGRQARRLRSTRLVLARYRAHDANRPIGLIVEHATRTRRIERDQFVDSGVATPNTRWLGPIASDGGTIVQWIDPQQMLDDVAEALVFPSSSAPSPAALQLDDPSR